MVQYTEINLEKIYSNDLIETIAMYLLSILNDSHMRRVSSSKSIVVENSVSKHIINNQFIKSYWKKFDSIQFEKIKSKIKHISFQKELRFICEGCDERFESISRRDEHRISCKNYQLYLFEQEQDSKKFTCPKCKSKFTSVISWREHKLYCLDKENFKVPEKQELNEIVESFIKKI